jgi:hypothetical protein
MTMMIEPYEGPATTRRFCWRLTESSQPTVLSTESFATKREATQAGEIALQRAIERGCIRPTVKRRRDPDGFVAA